MASHLVSSLGVAFLCACNPPAIFTVIEDMSSGTPEGDMAMVKPPVTKVLPLTCKQLALSANGITGFNPPSVFAGNSQMLTLTSPEKCTGRTGYSYFSYECKIDAQLLNDGELATAKQVVLRYHEDKLLPFAVDIQGLNYAVIHSMASIKFKYNPSSNPPDVEINSGALDYNSMRTLSSADKSVPLAQKPTSDFTIVFTSALTCAGSGNNNNLFTTIGTFSWSIKDVKLDLY